MSKTEGHAGEVSHLAFGPNGKWLASAAWDGIRFWDVPTAKPLREIATGQGGSFSLFALSRDGKLLISQDYKGAIHRWDANTGKALPPYPVPELNLPKSAAIAVVVSSDGSMLLARSYTAEPPWRLDKLVRSWDLATGKE